MRVLLSLFIFSFLAVFGLVVAKDEETQWFFQDGTVSIRGRGKSIEDAERLEPLTSNKPVAGFLNLSPDSILRINLTATENAKPSRPHQLMLVLREPHTGTEESFPFKAMPDGKAELELTQKDLPLAHLLATRALVARLHVGSFGFAQPLQSFIFLMFVKRDESVPLQIPDKPLRYGKLPEIHHIFKDDPKSPPVFITAFISMFIVAALPVLIGVWLTIGLNMNGISEAFNVAPVSHGLFVGSILAMEMVFVMYYLSWNLFQTLPVAAVIGVTMFVSGSRALSEVQKRRLAGKR